MDWSKIDRESFLIPINIDQLTQLCFQPINRLRRRFLKMRIPARFLYSFLDLIFLQVDVLEWEYKNLGFENFVKNVSPKCFEIEAWTHTRVPYSFPG